MLKQTEEQKKKPLPPPPAATNLANNATTPTVDPQSYYGRIPKLPVGTN
jgi:hypothetical protein